MAIDWQRHIVNSGETSKPWLDLLSWTLLEKAGGIIDIGFPNVIMTHAKPIVDEVINICTLSKDKVTYGLALICMGDIYYLKKNYETSLRFLKEAKDYSTNAKPQIKSRSLRTTALNWAYLNKKREFLQTEKEIIQFIDEGRFSRLQDASKLLEGVGRGQGLLLIPNSFETLERSREILANRSENGKIPPLRSVQIARSQLEVMKIMEPSDIGTIDKIGQEGFKIAFENGYERHATKIRQYLDALL
jgi:hypothetical protein